MKPTTVQMWARNGLIPYDTTPGGHRRFDLEEVRAALAQREDAAPPPGARTRGSRGWLVDGSDIAAWAARTSARGELPEAIGWLVAGSTPELLHLEFRTKEGVRVRGYDGIVENARGNRWVPSGHSVWEVGTDEDVIRKADDDYNKRKADPGGFVPSETTFVFVSARRWDRRDAWAREKQAEAVWKDVVAFDADSLERWLDENPAVHVRVTRLLGRDPDGATDLVSSWGRWTCRTVPPIPPSLLIDDRGDEVAAVDDWLHGEPSALSVVAVSQEEALAFVSARLLALPDDEREAVIGRTLVVRARQAWDEILARSGSSMILVPTFDSPVTAEATDLDHWVIVPVDQRTVVMGKSVQLSQVSVASARRALAGAGVPAEVVSRLARVARRSLQSLRRRLASDATVATPLWAQPDQVPLVAPLVLAGSWRYDNDADKQVLQQLSGRPYSDFEAQLPAWANSDDPLVKRSQALWFVVSKDDAWDLVCPFVGTEQLERFRSAAVAMFTTPDPALTVSPAGRWVAGIFGRRLPWSTELRRSIAESVALLACHGGDRDFGGGLTGQDIADRIVAEVLGAANEDATGALWCSVADVLPLLAEAAPSQFLDAVDSGLTSGAVQSVFQPEVERAPLGSPAHVGLVHALEVVPRDPEHVALAASDLARLAAADPGGRWVPRPLASLQEIFNPMLQNTGATWDDQLVIIDRLRRTIPEVSWKLMLGQLPLRYRVVTGLWVPQWRQGQQGPEIVVTPAVWAGRLQQVLTRVLEDVGNDAGRIATVVDGVDNLDRDGLNQVTRFLAGVDVTEIGAAGRGKVADALGRKISRHRALSDEAGRLPEWAIDALESELRRFSETGEDADVSWLFSDDVELPGQYFPDYKDERAAIETAQRKAVTSVLRTRGVDGLLELARGSRLPALVGITAANLDKNIDVEMLEQLGSDHQAEVALAQGYLGARFDADGLAWAEGHLAEARKWPASRAARFLSCLDASSATLDWVEQLGPDVQGEYWSSLSAISLRRPGDRERVALGLADHGRCSVAVTVLYDVVRTGGQPDPDFVERVLSGSSSGPDVGHPLFPHRAGGLLDYLEGVEDYDQAKVAGLEWHLMPIFQFGERSPRVLHAALARDPEFFVEIVGMVYGREDVAAGDLSDEDHARAYLAGQLLASWRQLPGGDGFALEEWVQRARALLAERKLLRDGDYEIGKALKWAGEDPDGCWPPLHVRTVIEEEGSQDIERGLEYEVFSSRGATWRGIRDGGAQERELAEKYTSLAKKAGVAFPRTRRMLTRIADGWDSVARQEDALAEHREEFWS